MNTCRQPLHTYYLHQPTACTNNASGLLVPFPICILMLPAFVLPCPYHNAAHPTPTNPFHPLPHCTPPCLVWFFGVIARSNEPRRLFCLIFSISNGIFVRMNLKPLLQYLLKVSFPTTQQDRLKGPGRQRRRHGGSGLMPPRPATAMPPPLLAQCMWCIASPYAAELTSGVQAHVLAVRHSCARTGALGLPPLQVCLLPLSLFMPIAPCWAQPSPVAATAAVATATGAGRRCLHWRLPRCTPNSPRPADMGGSRVLNLLDLPDETLLLCLGLVPMHAHAVCRDLNAHRTAAAFACRAVQRASALPSSHDTAEPTPVDAA